MAGLGGFHGTASRTSLPGPELCVGPASPAPSPLELQENNVPFCHHLFPFPSWNVLLLVVVGGGTPRKRHSWKSDLYLKNKKSNKPQMFCDKTPCVPTRVRCPC